MSKWPNIQEHAPGGLVQTSGTEWLPSVSRLPVEFRGDAFLPDQLPGGLDSGQILQETWPDVERAVAALSSLGGLTKTLPNPYLLSDPFRLREAQASSRIENTIASAEEVALVGVGEESRDESVEVWNYLNASGLGLNGDRPVTQGLVKEMHQVLLRDGVRGSDLTPGVYRQSQAYIRGDRRGFAYARFVPPPGEHVQSSMDAYFQFIEDGPELFPAVICAAMSHYQFETIHPFSDGNGRLGRILILTQLNRAGLLARPMVDISSFFDRFRQEYCDLMLAVSLEGSWAQWIQFFCRGLVHQAQDAEKRANQLLELRRDFMNRVTEPRASALLRELVDYLFTRPAVRANDVAGHLEIQHNAAQRHLNRMVEKGILQEVTGRSTRRVYVAKEIFAVIEQNFDED